MIKASANAMVEFFLLLRENCLRVCFPKFKDSSKSKSKNHQPSSGYACTKKITEGIDKKKGDEKLKNLAIRNAKSLLMLGSYLKFKKLCVNYSILQVISTQDTK